MSVEIILFGRHNIGNFLHQTTDLHFVFICLKRHRRTGWAGLKPPRAAGPPACKACFHPAFYRPENVHGMKTRNSPVPFVLAK